MFFHKDIKNIPHKELRILRLDLINRIICLNTKQAELYKKKCDELGYDLLSLDKAFPKIKFSYNINLEEEEDEFKKNYFLRERKKQEKKKSHVVSEKKKKLNKKRKHNNNNSIEKIKDMNYLYNQLKKNKKEFYNNSIISKKDLYKYIKSLDNKINSKKEKNYVLDKIQLPFYEINQLRKELKRRIENLTLPQVIEINKKFGNNNENEINIELNKLSQEQLKRLKNNIEDYENNNAIDPNFINYKEEMKKKPNEQVNNINIIEADNNVSNNFSDSSDSDDDDDEISSSNESNFQRKFILQLQNNENLNNDMENDNENNLNNGNIKDDNINSNNENLLNNNINNDKDLSKDNNIKDENNSNNYNIFENDISFIS